MSKKNLSKNKITKAEADQYEMLYPILSSVYDEIKELSKKKQDGVLNEVKVKMANRILSKVKTLLAEDPTNEFLDLLDVDNLPSNSDAVLIIAQFRAAMHQYKDKHFGYFPNLGEVWDTQG